MLHNFYGICLSVRMFACAHVLLLSMKFESEIKTCCVILSLSSHNDIGRMLHTIEMLQMPTEWLYWFCDMT